MIFRKNKYHNEKTEIDGIEFDSKREAQRYRQLKVMEYAGEIRNIRMQVPYPLIEKHVRTQTDGKTERAVKYIADFVYEDKDGCTHVEDAKGMRTREYILKRKLMLDRYGIEIEEV